MDETGCNFVSSRGILKSCEVHSATPISSCATDTQRLVHYVAYERQRKRATIYVCSEALRYFVRQILPRMRESFILVSGDSDLLIPNEALSQQELRQLLTHPLLIMWYAQNNITAGHYPKLQSIPIGLDYHTIAAVAAEHRWGPAMSPAAQEAELRAIRAAAPPWAQRKPLVYSNMHFALDRWGDRKAAIDGIPAEVLVLQAAHMPRAETWAAMAQHRFVVSPYGNGYDCHRTWEALALGCVPIVCNSPFGQLFEGLPVLQVGAWSEVTPELLEKAAAASARFSGMTDIIPAKLTLEYWRKKIQSGT